MSKQANAISYRELAKGRISKSRSAVISACSAGGFTIAQQFEATENDKPITVFLKGAMHVDDLEGLITLRNAIDVAIAGETLRNDV